MCITCKHVFTQRGNLLAHAKGFTPAHEVPVCTYVLFVFWRPLQQFILCAGWARKGPWCCVGLEWHSIFDALARARFARCVFLKHDTHCVFQALEKKPRRHVVYTKRRDRKPRGPMKPRVQKPRGPKKPRAAAPR